MIGRHLRSGDSHSDWFRTVGRTLDVCRDHTESRDGHSEPAGAITCLAPGCGREFIHPGTSSQAYRCNPLLPQSRSFRQKEIPQSGWFKRTD